MKEMTLVNGFVRLCSLNWFPKFTIFHSKRQGTFAYLIMEITQNPHECCPRFAPEKSRYIPNLQAHAELLPKLAGSQTGFLFENDADILRLKPRPLRNL